MSSQDNEKNEPSATKPQPDPTPAPAPKPEPEEIPGFPITTESGGSGSSGG